MISRLHHLIVAIVFLWPSGLSGQDHLLRDVVHSIDQALLLVDYDRQEPEQCQKLLSNLSIVRNSLEDFLQVDSAIGEINTQSKSLRFIAHGHRELVGLPSTNKTHEEVVDQALRKIVQVVEFPVEGLAEYLDEAVGPDETDEILEPFNRLQIEELTASMARNQDILNRYAKKFGPGSVQLNPLETLLNFLFQSVPGFGPNALGSPGALEWVAAYNTGYLSYGSQEEDFNVIAAAEIGVRFYFLQNGWGEGNPLMPRYASAGLLISGQDDGALITPWQGDSSRFGAFVSWGDYKFAFLNGDQSRFLFTRQFQFFNHLF